jgi:hypothetical protein
MKDIRPALRAFLLGDPTVSSLVGGVRVHSSRLPQNQVEPSVVYVKVSEVGDYNMAGDSGLGQVRMQIDSWAQSNDAATQLANAVYDRLSGLRDTISFDSSSIDVKGTFLALGREDYDSTMQMFRVSRDFTIWYGATA